MGKPKNCDAKEFFKGYLSSDQAAKIAGVTPDAVYLWCKQYKLGKKVGSRWLIFPDRFKRFMEGKK